MLSINLIERIIMDSIYKQERSFEEIESDTTLPVPVIENCLMTLLSKSIITKKLNKYYFNTDLTPEAIKAINSESNKLKAKKLILDEVISNSSNEDINFYKVSLNEREEKIFKGLLYNVEEFLKSVALDKESKTTNEKIIYWGESTYGKVINNLYS